MLQKLAEKVIKGKRFDMNDMRDQLQQMLSMGGLSSMLDKLPGAANLSESVKSKVNDKEVHRMVAIISSMTKKERRHPDLLNGSRKARVARGSGTQPADVNRLLRCVEYIRRFFRRDADAQRLSCFVQIDDADRQPAVKRYDVADIDRQIDRRQQLVKSVAFH